MARDPLASLIQLRRLALDDAQRGLVKCLNTEAVAQRLARDAERVIARETEAASEPTGTDSAVEAFAAWLPGARAKLQDALRDLESKQAETTRARAGVTACRTALESVETLQAERKLARRSERERRAQLDLEDRPSRSGADDTGAEVSGGQ